MYTLIDTFQPINLIDTFLSKAFLLKLTRKALIAAGVLLMSVAMAALVLTVIAFKLIKPIYQEIEMSFPKYAKKSITYTVAGFSPRAILKPSKPAEPAEVDQAPATQPITIDVEATPVPETPETSDSTGVEYSLEDLQKIAKDNKVKGWNFFKSAEKLQAKLESLGVI